MVFTVSINGPDNAGKTTQISLLPAHWSIGRIGSLHEYDEGLAGMVKDGSLKDWWWSCPDDEFVKVIFSAVSKRYSIAQELGEAKLAIFDRGAIMFQAVATATIAVKRGWTSLDKAREVFQSSLAECGASVPREQVCILLKQHQDAAEALRIGLERESEPVDERYGTYQSLLHEEIMNQQHRGSYHSVCIEKGEDSHIKIQNEIRAAIAKHTLSKVLTPVLSTVSRIYAIGGLSECGKSTFASRIEEHFGSECHRLKIGYLLELASRRLGKDIHSLPERNQAFALVGELHAYTQSHYWLRYLTIESVHRFGSIDCRKRLLGQKLQIVYIEASLQKRQDRSRDPLSTLAQKDVTKTQRGADRVKDIADLVLDNNGSMSSSLQHLQRYLRADTRRCKSLA